MVFIPPPITIMAVIIILALYFNLLISVLPQVFPTPLLLCALLDPTLPMGL